MVTEYASATEVAGYLGLSPTETQTAAQINLFLSMVQGLVDQYCQTTFMAENDSDKIFNGTGTEILVPGYFIRTLNSITIIDSDGNDLYTIDDAAVMPDAPRQGVYRWLERRQSSNDSSNPIVFPQGLRNIKVNADWGLDTLPAQIKVAVAMGIQHCWNMRDFNNLVQQETGFGRSVFYTDLQKIQFLPEFSRKILDSFINSRWFSV